MMYVYIINTYTYLEDWMNNEISSSGVDLRSLTEDL